MGVYCYWCNICGCYQPWWHWDDWYDQNYWDDDDWDD